jgi:hypothetical protein
MKELQGDYQTREELQDRKGFSNLDTRRVNPKALFTRDILAHNIAIKR